MNGKIMGRMLRKTRSVASIRFVFAPEFQLVFRFWLYLADFEVAKPNLAAVLLKQDMAFDTVAKSADVLELTLRDRVLDRFAAAPIFQDFDAVEPVFHAASLHDDP